MVRTDLQKAGKTNLVGRDLYNRLEGLEGSGGGELPDLTEYAKLEDLDTATNFTAINPTLDTPAPEVLDKVVTDIENEVKTNATNIATNTTKIGALDDRVTAVEGGGSGGGGGARTITLDLNEYIDEATSIATVNCLDLDPSISIVHLIRSDTAIVIVEAYITNIALTNVSIITFAPKEVIVTSATNYNYKRRLAFFKMVFYKEGVDGAIYSPLTATHGIFVIEETGFDYTHPSSEEQYIAYIGLFQEKYVLYFEKNVVTDEVKELFFYDPNVLFSTSGDTDSDASLAFLLKLHYSVCLFVDKRIISFGDMLDNMTRGAPLERFLRVKSDVLNYDGTTTFSTGAYDLTYLNAKFADLFFNASSPHLTRQYLNNTRINNWVGYGLSDSPMYLYYTYINIGDSHAIFSGGLGISDTKATTLQSVSIIPKRGLVALYYDDTIHYVSFPILYMNSYYYES